LIKIKSARCEKKVTCQGRKRDRMKKTLLIAILILMVSGCTTYLSLSEIQNLADKGDADAQNNMGSRYQFGDGVPKDYGKAVMYYQKAVDQNLSYAKTNLGYMYDLGLGVAEDNEKAIFLYSEAANAGDSRGMINLAIMYADGDNVEQSFEKAYFWLEIARFYTQLSSDKQAKWRTRALRDQVMERLSVEKIKRVTKLSHDWIEERGSSH